MCLISYSVYRGKVKEMVLKLYPLKHLFFFNSEYNLI